MAFSRWCIYYCIFQVHKGQTKNLKNNENFFEATQLLGYISWDRVSCKHNSFLIVGFLIYGEHLNCILQGFLIKTIIRHLIGVKFNYIHHLTTSPNVHMSSIALFLFLIYNSKQFVWDDVKPLLLSFQRVEGENKNTR